MRRLYFIVSNWLIFVLKIRFFATIISVWSFMDPPIQLGHFAKILIFRLNKPNQRISLAVKSGKALEN